MSIEAEVIRTEILRATVLVSQISNWLYPDMPMAADREARFYNDGGEFALNIAAAAKRHAIIYTDLLAKAESKS